MGSPGRGLRARQRRLLVVLTLVAGVLGGLLAMHFGIEPIPADSPAAGASASAGHAHPMPATEGCADDCAPGDDEWQMAAACVLGLLVLQLVVAIPCALRASGDLAAALVAGPHREPTPLARPPDLDTLCISRT